MPDWVLLTIVGIHVPLMPFVEVDGKIGAVLPLQISFRDEKIGNILSVIVWVSEVAIAH